MANEFIHPASTGQHLPTTEEVLELMTKFVGPDGKTSNLSNESTPPEVISHALAPGITDFTEGQPAVCGAPWISSSSIGGDPILCSECIRIGLSNGYQYT